MASPHPATKTDRMMEQTMAAVADDPERHGALSAARAFKRSWIELASALRAVSDNASYERWGYKSFQDYCRLELHLKPATVGKLLGSYRFLESNAPQVLERRREPNAPLPSLEAVDFVRRAEQRGAADKATMREIETAAFEEGIEGAGLSRRFKEVAFPIDRRSREQEVRTQIASAARRLVALLADEDSPVRRDVAAGVEESVGLLLEAIEN
ncbi:MAG TPA: hypothetical protein VL172_18465 [Kofleriaceae bacterium]|jgi:hypothetical protein|nr:hypothetical protein [Kofleriaceae bacterium]